MSRFLEECSEFIRSKVPAGTIRISEMCEDGVVETVHFQKLARCQNSYSVAKTFTMTGIGLLYDKGLLGIDEKIYDILKDEIHVSEIDERWNSSTIEMALIHRLGLPGACLDIDSYDPATFGKDYLDYIFKTPLISDPGISKSYTDAAFYLLARIVEKRSGMNIEDFLWKELLFKLGFKEIAWSHCPLGHAMGGTGLYVSSEDIARLAYVYMTGGVYNGERLLSEKWIELAKDKGFTLSANYDHTFFSKGGMYGQKIMFSTKQHRAIGLQAFGGNSEIITEWIMNYGE
ncbi:MAG: beta-lactamase family protein [Ruminococcaceae bacterium]|nr:beta-lactamase family protein [Oscillospiraceae bacterium]